MMYMDNEILYSELCMLLSVLLRDVSACWKVFVCVDLCHVSECTK